MNNYNLKLNKETIHQGVNREYMWYSFKARILAQDSDAIYFKNGSRQTREPTFV